MSGDNPNEEQVTQAILAAFAPKDGERSGSDPIEAADADIRRNTFAECLRIARQNLPPGKNNFDAASDALCPVVLVMMRGFLTELVRSNNDKDGPGRVPDIVVVALCEHAMALGIAPGELPRQAEREAVGPAADSGQLPLDKGLLRRIVAEHKAQVLEIAELRRQIDSCHERISAQARLLTKQAERPG